MKGFIGKKQNFGRATDVVDSDRLIPWWQGIFVVLLIRYVIHLLWEWKVLWRARQPHLSSRRRQHPDTTCGSTGRKRKSVGTDNLVDFVKDFNHKYLARVKAQDIDKWTWETDVLAFDTAREAKSVKNESRTANMDQFFYELKVKKTKNVGNMTSVLILLASSYEHSYKVLFSTLIFSFLSSFHGARLLRWFVMWLAFWIRTR